MSPKSGWCTSPPNTRPHCGECVSLMCDCGCHHDQTCPACLAPVLSDTHHETCVAPLDVLCGESSTAERDSAPLDNGSVVYDKGTSSQRKAAPNRLTSTGASDHNPAKDV